MSKLYLIPTPIGNLEDITFRAIKVLKEVDIILAEDTRVTNRLLRHYQIETQIFSFHMHNEHKVLKRYIDKILEGSKIGLVSDAGTPAISDPGFLLVRECINNDIVVECLPGATAFLPAIVNSGIPCEKFIFEGFLPLKRRKNKLESLINEKRTMVFYESPYRIIKTLTQFIEYFGEEREASISREISKIFEETIRGTLKELKQHFIQNKIKGEFVIVVSGK